MKIGEFAQLTNVPIKTLRYYSDIGLLLPDFHADSSYRHFGLRQLVQLNRVLSLKESGFTLNEIITMSDQPLSEDTLLRTLETKLKLAIKDKKMIEARMIKLQQQIHALRNRKEIPMKMNQIHVPPFNNTLMGLIRSACDYYSIDHSDAMLYGGSGQAFLMNIHQELCPSGPYVWNHQPFFDLLKNLGIQLNDHGLFTLDGPSEVQRIEQYIVQQLDKNIPCALVNLENQMILGYDETGFTLSQPWGSDFPGNHLTFGSWDEFGEDQFACFYTFESTTSIDKTTIFRASLEYALDLTDSADAHSEEGYATGLAAYDNFIHAVQEGHGSSHGNAWNATVWAECRKMASSYFVEMGNALPKVSAQCGELAQDFALIAEGLTKAADKGIPIKPKVTLLNEIKTLEANALEKIRAILQTL